VRDLSLIHKAKKLLSELESKLSRGLV
jgi:hypothetical protein